MYQSIPAAPRHPRATVGHLPALSVLEVGYLQIVCCPGPDICRPRGYSQAFDTHVVSYQNSTTKRILLEKQAYWHEKN